LTLREDTRLQLGQSNCSPTFHFLNFYSPAPRSGALGSGNRSAGPRICFKQPNPESKEFDFL